jgi:hypothetical protein
LLALGLAVGVFGGGRQAHAANRGPLAGGARAVSAIVDPGAADLSVSIAETAVNQISSTDILWVPGETLTYTLTINNTAQSTRVCDPPGDGLLKPLCYTEVVGANVSGVVVQDTLPTGVAFQSVHGDSGFACGVAGGVVHCTGGAISMGRSAHISIVVAPQAAAASYSITDTAVVNPNHTISERDYTNNTASLTTTVWFCPPTCIN